MLDDEGVGLGEGGGEFLWKSWEKKSLYGEIERVKEDKKAFIFPDCTTDVHKL